MGGDGVAILVGVVGRLELVPLAEEIEQVLWVRDRLDAKISEALRGFDAEQAWGGDGSLSLTSWLAAHGRRSHRDAHREAAVASRLAQLPVTAAAWSDGTLSSGQVAAIVANVSSDHAALYAQHEPNMTPLLAELSVADTTAAMRAWRLRADAEGDGPEPAERPSELYLSRTLDGRREVSGHLGAEDAAVVEAAIAAAEGSVPADGEGPLPSAAQRRAEALADVCRWFLTHGDKAPSGARHRPQLSVIVGLSDLAQDRPGLLADGTAVPGSTVSRLACDAVLHRIVMAGRSTVLDYGSSVRTVSPALWAALVVRDGHCRHPGCDRPPAWCEAHHVQHFSKGGPTSLSNLVMACNRHHHLWHDHGWQLELSPDGSLVLRSPLGKVITSRPPPAHLAVALDTCA
jgi:5-methylcytosine-specific restriction protein A